MLSDEYIEDKYNEKHTIIHVFNSILIYIKKIGFHFFLLFTTAFFSKNINKKIIIFSTSLNNEVALSPIKEQLNESIQLTKDYRLKRNGYLFPMFPPLVLSMILLPVFIYLFIKSNKKEKKRLLLFSHDILLSIGYDICVKYYLKYLSPKGIVFSNDHIFYTRSLIKHAKKKEIHSFYIQHSAVTEIFPPIISSFALLEGLESHRKYFPNGEISNNSFLIGSPKFDKYSNCINDNEKVSAIGICSTQSMNKDEVIILSAEC